MSDIPNPNPVLAPKRAMFIVFLVVFIDLLGFGIVLPLLPRYGKELLDGYSELSKGAILGALYSLFSLMQFIFSPVWGRVSDAIGRKPVLIISLSGSVFCYGLFAYASTLMDKQPTLALLLILLSRIGAGIAGASVGTAAAVIADCTTPERRAKGMALIGAAFGIGFTFGPLIAYAGLAVFDQAKWAPGAVASGLSFCALLLAVVLFKETLRRDTDTSRHRQFFSIQKTTEVLRNPAVGPLVLLYFLAITAFANFEGTLSLFTDTSFGMGEDDNFLVFAYIGFVLMVAQGGIYRPLAGRLSEGLLMAFGVGLMLIGMAALILVAFGTYALKESPDAAQSLKTLFYLAVTSGVCGFAFVNPSVASLISRRSDPKRQGEVLGVNQAFSALGRIIGPFVGLSVFELDPTRSAPYVVATVLLFAVAALLPSTRKEPKSQGGPVPKAEPEEPAEVSPSEDPKAT